ncbi:MAG: MaoC family dehydratase N-terminal domain-containing protein [Chloroflexi bacterium]|nr:MaoC family dehydratase N-terminal domain-containing protein [Chloroflexota bacterium]
MTEATLTEEMIASMKEKVGLDLRIDHSIFNEEATRLAIAKFAAGIGDINPLWTDAQYAAGSCYGGLVAPPSFVIGVFSGLQFGWPGLGSFHSGSVLRFFKPVLLNDKLTPTCRYDGFVGPKRSDFAEMMVMDTFTNRYSNQRDELVAEIEWSVINVERQKAKARGTEHGIPLPHPWSPEELAEIEAQVRAECPRGATPRYWEHVSRGDQLATLTKGPIGMTDEVAFVAGGGAPIPRLAAHAAALKDYERHPAWAFRDPEFSALEPVYAVHYNRHAARAMGVPYQYDVGFQRQCWQIQLLTHWMGDGGWVKNARAQYRRFVYLSDVVRLSGSVTEKYIDEDGEPCVDVETSAVNQRGENVMPGSATIVLPSLDFGSSPVARRLKR